MSWRIPISSVAIRRRATPSAGRTSRSCWSGIDVWTTVNVQHLESLNDLVAQITGVRQRETIPDRIFDEADEVELIDLPPDDLLARLKAGKIYVPRTGRGPRSSGSSASRTCIALRELALRRMADRVDAAARAAHATDRHVARLAGARSGAGRDRARSAGRAGRCVPASASPMRWMREWTVVYVETPALLRLSEQERNRRIDAAASRGIAGRRNGDARWPIRRATRCSNTPRPETSRASSSARRSAAAGAPGCVPRRRRSCALRRAASTSSRSRRAEPAPAPAPLRPSGRARAADPLGPLRLAHSRSPLVCTLIACAMYPYFELANIVMVYMLGSTVAGLRFGRGPAVLAAVAERAGVRLLFRAAALHVSVTDVQYLVTFAVMLIVALVIANLMANVRQQTRVAGARERRTALLYAMSRELAATRGAERWRASPSGTWRKCSSARPSCCCPMHAGKLRTRRMRRPSKARSRQRSGGCAMGARSRAARGTRLGYVARRARAVSAVGRRAAQLGVLAVLPHNRRLCAVAGAAAPARNIRGADRHRARARAAAEQAEAARVPRRPKACAIRCWRRSRTTCARRSR